MRRPKLSIDEQIADMKAKGIAFLRSDEADAKRFLKNNNYYFKIKAYERNYDKYNSTPKKGQYINLDFEQLKWLFDDRMLQNKDYFEKNLQIKECYRFTGKIVSTFCNKYRK